MAGGGAAAQPPPNPHQHPPKPPPRWPAAEAAAQPPPNPHQHPPKPPPRWPAAEAAAQRGGAAGGGGAAADVTEIPGITPMPVGTGPTLADPSSGIDWDSVWGDFNSEDTLSPANLVRTGLEASRLIPGWGLIGGMAADIISAAQDFSTLPDDAPEELQAILLFRSGVQIINNALGHIAYVDQLIQDALAGSVVGAEFVPVTAAINEAVMAAKVTVGSVQFLCDIVLEAAALYQRENSPPGSDSWKAYDSMASNFAANLVGDVVGLTLDVISLSTAGVANDGPIRTGANATKAAFPVAKTVGQMILQFVQGLFNVYGGSGVSAVGGGDERADLADPTGMNRLATFAVIHAELTRTRHAYDVGDTVLEMLQEGIDSQIEAFRELAMEFTDGQDPFVMMRDAAVQGLDNMRQKVASARTRWAPWRRPVRRRRTPYARRPTTPPLRSPRSRYLTSRCPRSTSGRACSLTSVRRSPTPRPPLRTSSSSRPSPRSRALSTRARTWPSRQSTRCAAMPTRPASSSRSSPTSPTSR